MDFATIIGLVVALGAITGAFTLEGGNMESIFGLAPMLIVIGGTLGATIITTSVGTVARVPTFLWLAFSHRRHNFGEVIEHLISLAEKARREGILGLEADLTQIEQPFFRKAVQLLIDGTEVTVLRDILETEMAWVEDRHQRGIVFFQKSLSR